MPDVGEGLTEGEILKWYVQPGDTVKVNQTIVEIETAKAAVELPSPFSGVVAELLVGEGTTVDVGTPIIAIDPAGGGSAPSPAGAGAEPATTAEHPTEPAEERQSVLVGYGPRSQSPSRRRRRQQAAPAAPVAAPASEPVPDQHVAVLAKPPVRKLARDLGVDLAALVASGPGGTITREDVRAAAAGSGAEARVVAVPEARVGALPEARVGAVAGAVPAFDETTRERRIPIRGVRRMTAEAMVASAFTAPHVTEFLAVDVTQTMAMVDRLKGMPEFADVKVSPLLLVAKALLVAIRRHPEINASWDEAAQEIVVKGYVNLGIASATPRGLVVPNIKNAGALALPELAAAMQALVTTARTGKTPPRDMTGGTVTITNVGVFGVDTGTPILNPGEAAILATGQIRPMPWVHEGEVVPRQVAQLALSFDHRLVDGELGSRVLADVGAILEDPLTALAWS
ncbi:MAG: dihydrolipoamide acetyltransferase family protein [Streptomycetales bacterium]